MILRKADFVIVKKLSEKMLQNRGCSVARQSVLKRKLNGFITLQDTVKQRY